MNLQKSRYLSSLTPWNDRNCVPNSLMHCHVPSIIFALQCWGKRFNEPARFLTTTARSSIVYISRWVNLNIDKRKILFKENNMLASMSILCFIINLYQYYYTSNKMVYLTNAFAEIIACIFYCLIIITNL